MILDRRTFLRSGLLGITALGIDPGGTLARAGLARGAGAGTRVVIVGAGMAGLAAGLDLVESGADVTILEARTRPGGRIRTLRAPFADGLYAEAGAARIPASHDLTREYCSRFGLSLEPFQPPEPQRFLIDGELLSFPGLEMDEFPLPFNEKERELGINGFGGHYIGPVLEEIGDPREPGWPPPDLAHLDELSLADWLRNRGASEAAVALFDTGYGFAENVSALELLMHLKLGLVGYEKISGGMERLPGAMAEILSDRVVYGAPVVRIEHGPDGAAAVVRRPGSHERHEGDHLIVTVPFTVLRDVELAPVFSREKMRAIGELPYEDVTRVFVQTGSRFWEEEGLSGFARTDHPMEIWDATLGQPGARGILLSYMRGPLSRRVADMDPAGRVRYGLDAIADAYPGVRMAYEGGTSWAWSDERWSKGAYAYARPGDMMELHHHTGTPEGRVHFAGEHTSVWPGWIQGALHSGRRAAREVAKAGVEG